MKALKKIFTTRKTKVPYLFHDINSDKYIGDKPLLFCTGMGRSGTHFMATLMSLSNDVAAYHLDEMGNAAADSFYQFSKWFGVRVDTEALFTPRFYLANKALNEGKFFFEANPYLNLFVPDLLNSVNCKVVVIYRDPQKVVESHYNKGWYKNYTPQFDPQRAAIPGYQYVFEKPHHFFGRFFPQDEASFAEWKNYTTVGKIAWMWATVYHSILNSITASDNFIILRTERLDYFQYIGLTKFLGVSSVEEKLFNKVVQRKPGKGNYHTRPLWNEKEKNEFHALTDSVLEQLEKHSRIFE